MTVVITGSRHWGDPEHWEIVRARLKQIQEDHIARCDEWVQANRGCAFIISPVKLVHGGARGVDFIADTIARELEFDVVVVHAEWVIHGRAAGPIRNRRMLGEHNPDLVIAFHDDITNSKGTKDCFMEAKVRRIEAEIVTGPRPKGTL